MSLMISEPCSCGQAHILFSLFSWKGLAGKLPTWLLKLSSGEESTFLPRGNSSQLLRALFNFLLKEKRKLVGIFSP